MGLTDVRMSQLPFDPSKFPKKDGKDPVFFAYTGPDEIPYQRCKYPHHVKAFYEIQDYAICEFPESRQGFSFAKAQVAPWFPFKWPVRADSVEMPSKIDQDGNTMLNRLLMSHVVITERVALRIFAQLKKRRLISLKPNRFGQTPLMLAVESGWPNLTQEILKMKPNMAAKDKEGRDAIDYLHYSAIFPDDRYIAPVYIFTAEAVGTLLVDAASPNQNAKTRVLRHLRDIREYGQQIDFGGIVP